MTGATSVIQHLEKSADTAENTDSQHALTRIVLGHDPWVSLLNSQETASGLVSCIILLFELIKFYMFITTAEDARREKGEKHHSCCTRDWSVEWFGDKCTLVWERCWFWWCWCASTRVWKYRGWIQLPICDHKDVVTVGSGSGCNVGYGVYLGRGGGVGHQL